MSDHIPEGKAGYVKAADGHVYHKSSTANATVAPTNDHTIENAAKVGDLNFKEAEFVTILDYEWGRKTDITDPAFREEYGYSEEEWLSYVSNPKIIKALDDRGVKVISLVPNAPEVKSPLTPLQLIVANTLLDLTDTRSTKKKLQDAGVTTYKYQSWLKDPIFSGYLRERAEAMLGDVQHEAMLSIVDRVQAGDMKAIEYYHELTGRFVREKASTTGPANHDLQAMIVRIIEIIIDEVDDQATALRISDRLKGLVTGAQVAGLIPAPEPISVPEVATERVITPEVKALMDKGLGYDS